MNADHLKGTAQFRQALQETFWIALDTLRSHKLRTFLTLLGVMLAVTTLVAVMSILNGLNLYVADKVANLGSNAFVIDRVGIATNLDQWNKARRRPPLRMDDLKALRDGMKLADRLVGLQETFADVRYGNIRSDDVRIIGATPEYTQIRNIDAANGRLLTSSDEEHRSGVCVIGSDLAAKLFTGIDPIGKDIRAGQGQYEIVGVAAPKGTVLGQPQDNFVMMPLGTYRKEWLAPQDSIQIFVEARSRQSMSPAADEARVILRARRHVRYEDDDNFGLVEPASLLGIWDSLTRNIFGVAVWVTSIFLVVGGIVIMNIMLASVTERTREIGLRKSLGARRRDIVMLIILVVGLVEGFRSTIQDEITSSGVNTAWAWRFNQGPTTSRRPKEERDRKPLTLADGQAVQQLCPSVKQTTIAIYEWTTPHNVRYQKNEVQGGEFRGTFSSYPQVDSSEAMKAGRFFTEAENEHKENVVVIGEDVATALFRNIDDALGKQVLVDGSDFMVVGVFEKPVGGIGTNDEDRRVVIPYYTFTKIFPASFEVFLGILAYPGKLDVAVDQTREVLRRRRNVPYDRPDDFSIQTNAEAVQQFNDIIGGVALVVVVLSSIGLLIGGIGVMNIMLVSVTERTREIGVRKAIGARSRDITWQFLFEAMTLTGTGGILGILVGCGTVLLVPVVSSLKAVIPVWAVIIGFVVSVSIGLIFGVWPATKAARLNPVEALRYE